MRAGAGIDQMRVAIDQPGRDPSAINVDPLFSDVVDGLLTADLTHTDPKVLERYLTADGLRTFLARHRR